MIKSRGFLWGVFTNSYLNCNSGLSKPTLQLRHFRYEWIHRAGPMRSNHLRHAVCERCCWQEIDHHKSTRCARHTSSLQQQPHWFSVYECCGYHVTELIFRHNLWVNNNLMTCEGREPRAFLESGWFIMTTCMTLTEHYPVSQDHFSVSDSLFLIRVKTQQSSCYHA